MARKVRKTLGYGFFKTKQQANQWATRRKKGYKTLLKQSESNKKKGRWIGEGRLPMLRNAIKGVKVIKRNYKGKFSHYEVLD